MHGNEPVGRELLIHLGASKIKLQKTKWKIILDSIFYSIAFLNFSKTDIGFIYIIWKKHILKLNLEQYEYKLEFSKYFSDFSKGPILNFT